MVSWNLPSTLQVTLKDKPLQLLDLHINLHLHVYNIVSIDHIQLDSCFFGSEEKNRGLEGYNLCKIIKKMKCLHQKHDPCNTI